MDPCVLIYTYTPIHTRAHRIFPSPLISWAMLPWRCLSLFHNNEWHTWNSFRQDHSYPHLHCQAMSYPHVHTHTHTQEHTRTEPRHFAGLTDFLWAIVSASRWWYPGDPLRSNFPPPFPLLLHSFSLVSFLLLPLPILLYNRHVLFQCTLLWQQMSIAPFVFCPPVCVLLFSSVLSRSPLCYPWGCESQDCFHTVKTEARHKHLTPKLKASYHGMFLKSALFSAFLIFPHL